MASAVARLSPVSMTTDSPSALSSPMASADDRPNGVGDRDHAGRMAVHGDHDRRPTGIPVGVGLCDKGACLDAEAAQEVGGADVHGATLDQTADSSTGRRHES